MIEACPLVTGLVDSMNNQARRLVVAPASGSELAPSTDSGDARGAQPAPSKLEEVATPPVALPPFSQRGGLGTLTVVPDELPPVNPESLRQVEDDSIPF